MAEDAEIWKEILREEMLEDLRNSPRHQVELIPYYLNIIENTNTIAQAVIRINDAYLDAESKMYFTYFCGKIVERGQWHQKFERELEKTEEEIANEIREEFKEAIENTNAEFRQMKADLDFIKVKQSEIEKVLKKKGLKLEDVL